MDKATKAIRRSGTKLRGLSSRHSSLQVLIGQLGDVRTTCKGFISAQQTAADDLCRWTNDCDNRAMQDVCAYLAELSLLWSEVQKEFADRLREYRTQFELILEGERHVDQSRELYSIREQREMKCRKELAKCAGRDGGEEVKLMEERVVQAEKGKDLAYMEVVDRIKENETVKLIRFREGLRKISAAYITLGQHCQAIFTAFNSVACTLPDVHNKDIHDVRYTGSREAAIHVQKAKEKVLGPQCDSPQLSNASLSEKQRVQIPDEDRPELPPKRGSAKHSEASRSNVSGTQSHSSSGSMPYDPPPSYSSVVEEDNAQLEGACGFTPSARPRSHTSHSQDQPIQISYPPYLNARTRTAPTSPPASAPASSQPSVTEQEANDASHPYRGLARSVSDRRSMAEVRGSVHPILRRHESAASARPFSTYEDYSITRNETQMSSVRLRKLPKKLSLKSLSHAAGNTISGFLGFNNPAPRYEPGVPADSDEYESYDFSSSHESSSRSSDDIYKKTNYGDVHGVLPEEMDRKPLRETTGSLKESDPKLASSSDGSQACERGREKSLALSAKFALPIPSAELCREDLSSDVGSSVTIGSSSAVPDICAIASPPGNNSRKKKCARSQKKKSSQDTLNGSDTPSRSETVEEINNLDRFPGHESDCQNGKLDCKLNVLDQNLIDLNVSNDNNTTEELQNHNKKNLQESMTCGNPFKQHSSCDPLIQNIPTSLSVNNLGSTEPQTFKSSSSPTINVDLSTNPSSSQEPGSLPLDSVTSTGPETTNLGMSTGLDGQLASLAKKRTNPFYEPSNSEESDTDTSNSVAWQR